MRESGRTVGGRIRDTHQGCENLLETVHMSARNHASGMVWVREGMGGYVGVGKIHGIGQGECKRLYSAVREAWHG